MTRLLHSLRLQLTLWYAGLLALALALFAVGVYVFVLGTLQTNIDQALQSYGQKVNRLASQHVHGRQLDVNRLPVPQIAGKEALAAIVTMNIMGQQKSMHAGHVLPDVRALRFTVESGHETCGTIKSGQAAALAKSFRFCTKLLTKHGKPVGGVEVVTSLTGVDRAIDRLRLALILGIPFVLLLAVGGGWLLAGRALEPVDGITSLARSITATDLSRRINVRRQDELGRLAGTFDEMIDRLERAFAEQRRLTADVSHELRSPLTILEAQTSLALRRGRTTEEYQQILVSVQEEVEHMSTMVNQLMTLARADAGEETVTLAPLDLSSVAEPIVEAMRPVAAEKQVTLALHPHEVWVMGDEGKLRRLLLNLIDNALQYTSSGGRIDVVVAQGRSGPMIRVADTGEGIDAIDLPHIFERFYRSDRARSRGMGNSGLGLAIVRWIAQAHGGSVRVRSRLGRGSEFTVRLQPADQQRTREIA